VITNPKQGRGSVAAAEAGLLSDCSASILIRKAQQVRDGLRCLPRQMLQGEISRAGIFLILRQGAITALNIGSTVAVARWLGPEILGRFAILILVTQGVLGYFGDLGLKAALIRKHGGLEEVEIATSQKLILGFSLLLVLGIGACLPPSFRWVHLGPDNFLPAAILLLDLIVRNLRLVPLAILERSMRFQAVSGVEAAESLFYALTLVALAYLQWGVWAFVLAMVCRDVFGVAALHFITRPAWRGFRWNSIDHHIKFSLFYQGAALMNMLTTAFPTVILARMIGATQVGYVNWASSLSLYSLVICNALARMYLPAFSGRRHDSHALCSLVEKAMRINASIAFPACAVLAGLSGPIIAFVFTSKWQPAQPALYAYCLAAVLTAIGTPLNELFFSLDDAGFNFCLSACWAALTWTAGLLSVHYYGFIGFVAFYSCLQVTWFLAFFRARRLPGLQLWSPVAEPFVFSVMLFATNLLLVRIVHLKNPQLLALLVVEGFVCAGMLLRTALVLKRPHERMIPFLESLS